MHMICLLIVKLAKLQTNGSEKWKIRVDNLLSAALTTFFPKQYGYNVMQEIACESLGTCNRDMICYKGLLSWWLVYTAQLVPYTFSQILPKLRASASAAAKTCTGGSSGNGCGIAWVLQKNVGTTGMEEDLSALGVFSANLFTFTNNRVPLSSSTGGKSKSDPGAGTSDPSADPKFATPRRITTADRVGAGILTAIIVSTILGTTIFMFRD
jgi:mannan endo-1,6-alpha-mannosidase